MCGGLEGGDTISYRRSGDSAKGPKRAQPVRPLIVPGPRVPGGRCAIRRLFVIPSFFSLT